jgi:sulfoxide reductase heme-binding subunit YedZ
MERRKMAPTRKSRKTWYLVLASLVALILVGTSIALRPYGTPLYWAIRGCALLGYLAIFLAIIISAYMRQMVRIFGRPFIQVHHILSVTGLVLITLHPLGVALYDRSLGVFVPLFDSWLVFLQLGGRPAWYLIGVASLAALLRKTFQQNWRAIHILNYLAFFLATVHAILIGTDFQPLIMKALPLAMSLVVVAIFIQKRLQRRRLRARRQ